MDSVGREDESVAMRAEALLMVAVGAVSWLLFLIHCCPTIYWRDASEFVTVGFTLGVSHPTGSPTYSMICLLYTSDAADE